MTASGRLQRLEPFGQLGVGDVGPAEVELGLAAVERAVADQDDPEGAGRRVRLELGFEHPRRRPLVGRRSGRLVAADDQELRRRPPRRLGPAVGPLGKFPAVFALAFGADDEDDRGSVGRHARLRVVVRVDRERETEDEREPTHSFIPHNVPFIPRYPEESLVRWRDPREIPRGTAE